MTAYSCANFLRPPSYIHWPITHKNKPSNYISFTKTWLAVIVRWRLSLFLQRIAGLRQNLEKSATMYKDLSLIALAGMLLCKYKKVLETFDFYNILCLIIDACNHWGQPLFSVLSYHLFQQNFANHIQINFESRNILRSLLYINPYLSDPS